MNTEPKRFDVKRKGWIGVDLDGTLAHYESGMFADGQIGDPIPRMLELVKQWLSAGEEVRLVTVRVHRESYDPANPYSPTAYVNFTLNIKNWMMEHIGQELKMQAHKDSGMKYLFDDRAFHVEFNTGVINSSPNWPASLTTEEPNDTPGHPDNPFMLPVCGQPRPSPESPPQTVPEIMQDMLKTFQERGKVYRNGYEVHADILRLIYPNGIQLETREDAIRFVLYFNMLTKMVRQGICLEKGDGGHKDSARDSSVYSAILESHIK